MRTLLETGVHFGHRTNKWNPKMDEFIFTQRNGIHIIDLQITLANLHRFHDQLASLIAGGGSVLFVGTKRQAQEIVQREAERCAMPYVNYRWLGGTLTNWKTIRSRIDTLKQLGTAPRRWRIRSAHEKRGARSRAQNRQTPIAPGRYPRNDARARSC